MFCEWRCRSLRRVTPVEGARKCQMRGGRLGFVLRSVVRDRGLSSFDGFGVGGRQFAISARYSFVGQHIGAYAQGVTRV